MGEIKIFFKTCSCTDTDFTLQVVATFKTKKEWLLRISLRSLVGDHIKVETKNIPNSDCCEVYLRLNINKSTLTFGEMTELGGMMMSVASHLQNIISQVRQLDHLYKDLTGTLKTILDGTDKEEKVGPASDCESTSSETC